jgi:LysM repeat protein
MKEKFQFKQPEERQRQKKLENEGRRDFIQIGLVTAAALAGGGLVNRLYNMGKKIEERNKQESGEQPQAENIPEEQILPPEEPEKIELDWEDKIILKQILKPSVNNELKVNNETISALTKYWIYEYQNRRQPELTKAFEEMNKIKPLLEERFKKYGVPSEFMYLAIPESGWRMNAVSKSGARGPYQFMPKTAEEYGLKNPSDPLESADACARFLRDLYKRTQNWDLALAGYNGGYMGRYEKKCEAAGQKMTYVGFLSELEKKINEKRQDILKRKYFYYTVKKDDSVYQICRQYGISLKKFKAINKLKEKSLHNKNKKKKISVIEIFPGQKLIMPINEKVKQISFEKEVAGLMENINYPPKFNATLDALGLKRAEYVAGRDQEKTGHV